MSKNEEKDHKSIGSNKIGGLSSISNDTKVGKEYFHTDKITIIGTSGSGKTTLAFDLAYYIVTPYKNIIYINSHFDDKVVLNFKKWCEMAGIGFYEIDHTEGLNIPDLDHSLYIIDDTYTSTKRDKALELLIKKLWNKGRWDGNHVIYIAHLDKFLPSEALYNATAIYIDRAYDKFPKSVKIEHPGKAWYEMINATDPVYGTIKKVEFDTPIKTQQIVRRLSDKKNKLPKDKEPIAGKKEYEGIGKQGNKLATKTASSGIIGGGDPSQLPMHGSILKKNINTGNISFNSNDF